MVWPVAALPSGLSWDDWKGLGIVLDVAWLLCLDSSIGVPQSFCGPSVGSTGSFFDFLPSRAFFKASISRRPSAGSIRHNYLSRLLRFLPIPPNTCAKKAFSTSSIAEPALLLQGVRCIAYSQRGCIRLLNILMLFKIPMPCLDTPSALS